MKPRFYRASFDNFILFALLFSIHRLLTFETLNAEVLTGTLRELQGLLVGLCSDLWIAGLLAVLIAGLFQGLVLCAPPGIARAVRMFMFAVIALGLSAHQSYVEYFGFPMMAFHLRYLYDSAFLTANGQSMFEWPLLVYLGALALGFVREHSWIPWPRVSRAGLIFIASALLLLVVHSRNILWRVQWFIPENLQMNLVEKLYMQLSRNETIDPISEQEKAKLGRLLGVDAESGDFYALLKQIGLSQQPRNLLPISRQLHRSWSQAVKKGKKPILAVLLMESMRPAETGYFARVSRTLTPELDRLTRRGIVFRQAYSTGSVTRGGQEAVFCGHISSRDTSLMRYDAVASIQCLPDFLNPDAYPESSVESFWYHGGNGLFDNQLSFWRKHGIRNIISEEQFPPEVARTSWGVGDISFLRQGAKELKKLHDATDKQALLGMLLTVSNHVPWDVPRDFVPLALPKQKSLHKSYHTTAYADHAIGAFVKQMKQQGLWDRTLLILVSDHGNQVPPYREIYEDSEVKSALLQSHINLVMIGGLVEAALDKSRLKRLDINHIVSQVDLSQFIAETLDIKGFVGMGENPFVAHKVLPVLSRLEQSLFDPKAKRLFQTDEFRSSSKLDQDELSIDFYRAYLDYIRSK